MGSGDASHGQSILLNCVHADIDFPAGGRLHVTEQGALPVAAGNADSAFQKALDGPAEFPSATEGVVEEATSPQLVDGIPDAGN